MTFERRTLSSRAAPPPRTAGLALAVAAAILAAAAGAARAAEAASLVRAVEAPGMTVSDMERSLGFYTGVLAFEVESDREVAGEAYERLEGVFGLRMRVVRLRLGRDHLDLTEYLAPRGRPIPPDSRSNDGWFQHVAIVVSDMDRAYRRLRERRVEHASTGPQTLPDWNPNAGGIRAFYFKDPDGHALELIWFPPGKGDPRWRAAGDALFLGIDHTAIAVRDTEASLRFYRDLLGLRQAGASENYGPEQERLNNVFGARLRITALRAPEGPGIELLEYLAPRDGRAYPADSRSNDLWHWQTTLVTDDAGEAAARTRGGPGRWVSPGAVRPPAGGLGFAAGALVRDPDGHAMLFIQR